MKKAKINKQNVKEKNDIVQETYSIKKFILIILILVVVLGAFYLITTFVVKPSEQEEPNNTITQIDYTKTTMNNLLNRKENEYYVLATLSQDNSQVNYLELYNNYINEYSEEENSLTFYNINLNDALNKNYIGDELNVSNNISEIKLNDDVLFKIKNSEIEEYFVGSKKILEKLSVLKES